MRKLFRLWSILLIGFNCLLIGDDGYRLWLKYDQIDDPAVLKTYRKLIKGYSFSGNSATIAAAEQELCAGLKGLLSREISPVSKLRNGVILLGTWGSDSRLAELRLAENSAWLGDEGYIIRSVTLDRNRVIVIAAEHDIGVLYGVFHFLRLLQTRKNIEHLDIAESPKIQLRLLNHWDNLDRTVERGYAGFSLWDWHKLPDYIHPYYIDYARANASIGINGAVLNNVNADPLIITPLYLEKVAALADVFRPYGVRVYLSVKFSAPEEIGGLPNADPLDKQVSRWWRDKVAEIYRYVPDFGGFLVKANSEGQPGPQGYGRSHADGANMLAEALAPYGGVVMWRAFVYDADNKEDRAKQAYNEFTPLDGKFHANVLVQVKNGPIDFQPREPFHPLFGAMPETPLMMEFQITQEYLGFSTHLVYLGTLFKEVLNADTYANGEGSTVAKVIDGLLDQHRLSGIAGVANTGTDRNWTGHLFGQANWYVFGRLAWNHQLTAEVIAEEWIRMTISNNPEEVSIIEEIMLASRENTVNYMTPLGLHHIMGWDHHYGPAPWIKDKHRDDWTSVYYHRADRDGIGFDRTATGSNAVSQYHPPVAEIFASLEKCPEKYLLWFHHLDWDYQMRSGRTLWDELCFRYYQGVEGVREMQANWNSLKGQIDEEQFRHVQSMLSIQLKEAVWWRNACVLYFQTFAQRPIPAELEKPDRSLEYYQNLKFPYAPK